MDSTLDMVSAAVMKESHVVIVACNYPLSAYMNCNSSLW